VSTVDIIQDGQALTVDASDPRAPQPVPPEPPRPFTLYKTDIEGRMTDDELTAFDTALSAATVRARRLWTDCQMVHSDDPFFATLTTQLTAAFGADRAAIILAKAS
jgi:hypothetical protein